MGARAVLGPGECLAGHLRNSSFLQKEQKCPPFSHFLFGGWECWSKSGQLLFTSLSCSVRNPSPSREERTVGRGVGEAQVTLPLVWAATGLGAAVTVSRKPALEGQGGPGKAGFLLDKHCGRYIYRCSRYRVGLLVG